MCKVAKTKFNEFFSPAPVKEKKITPLNYGEKKTNKCKLEKIS